MPKIARVCDHLHSLAPLALAADWDNVGLLVGDRAATVEKVMTCLTITPASAAEAIAQGASLIVTHHPLPFRSVKKITSDNTAGQMLLDLMRAGVAIYSAHTAFDSASTGINQDLAAGFGLQEIAPMIDLDGELRDKLGAGIGTGRYGTLGAPMTAADFVATVKDFLKISEVRVVTSGAAQTKKVGIACGSAGDFLAKARHLGCDTFVTGETNFHTCLEAEANNVTLILVGHYASERFAMERLADHLQAEFSELKVWASQSEADPLQTF